MAAAAAASPAAAAPLLRFTPATVVVAPGEPATVRVEGDPGTMIRVTFPAGFTRPENGAAFCNGPLNSAGALEFSIVGAAGAQSGELMAGAVSDPQIRTTAPISIGVPVPVLDPGVSLDVTDARSVVRLRGDISASVARTRENRSFAHSDLQPTGRYVRAGDMITVSGAPSRAVSVAVGVFGNYADINGGAKQDPVVLAAPGTTFSVKAPRDGMVFAINNLSPEQTITVKGGRPTAVFVGGETTTDTFKAQLAARTDVPFATVVGDRTFGDFRRGMIAQYADAVAERVASWDSVVAHTDRVYGLDRSSSGVAHRHSHRVYITNPDTGAGYASATEKRITFQVDTGAGADLFRRPLSDQWGLWHEIGHTYQTPQYKWAGMTEVTVNISSAAVQEANGWPSRLDTAGYRTKVAAFRKTPVGSRDFDTIDDLFVRLLMFDQLRRAFGEDFYPRLSQEYRVLVATGASAVQNLGTANAMKQLFMRTASSVANRDLSPFFRQWGLTPDAETTKANAAFRQLEAPIWENHDRKTDVRIGSVAPYAP